MANRLLGLVIGQGESKEEKELLKRGWIASMCFYISFACIAVLPMPALGITRDVVAELNNRHNLTGEWIDHPENVIAFGFLYFTAMAASTLFGHTWVKDARSYRKSTTP